MPFVAGVETKNLDKMIAAGGNQVENIVGSNTRGCCLKHGLLIHCALVYAVLTFPVFPSPWLVFFFSDFQGLVTGPAPRHIAQVSRAAYWARESPVMVFVFIPALFLSVDSLVSLFLCARHGRRMFHYWSFAVNVILGGLLVYWIFASTVAVHRWSTGVRTEQEAGIYRD